LRPDVWGRWQRWDPVNMLAQYAGALRSMRLLYLDAGTRDDFNLQYGARQFVAALQAHSVAHEYQEFDDGHSGTAYRYDVSLPRLAAALG